MRTSLLAALLPPNPAAHIPGPPLPSLLQTSLFFATPIQFLSRCQQDYGDVFFCRFFSQKIGTVFVTKPEDIRTVFTGDPEIMRAGEGNVVLRPVVGKYSLLVLDGSEHVRMRRLLLPPLHGERMPVYAQVVREQAEAMLRRCPPQAEFPLRPALQELTLQVILRAVFGLDDGAERHELAELLRRYADLASSVLLFFPQLQRDFGPYSPWGKVRALREQTNQALYQVIARRRSQEQGASDRKDVLSLLLAARDENGQPLSDRELRDELVTLLIAGHETTATALEWTLHLVLSHPQVRTRLRAELAQVVGSAAVSAEHLPQLEYLDAVLREALRLRPILPNVARKISQPIQLGGYHVPAGTFVAPCIYLTHRHKDLYPDPEQFLPERWLGKKPDPYQWLPFGGGARRCIGLAFALLEMKVVMAVLLGRKDLAIASDVQMPTKRRGITLSPQGVRLKLGVPPRE